MKIVYDEPVYIAKRIYDAVDDALAVKRSIKYIELTVREANELRDYVRDTAYAYLNPQNGYGSGPSGPYTNDDAGKVVGRFFGAEVRVELSCSPIT